MTNQVQVFVRTPGGSGKPVYAYTADFRQIMANLLQNDTMHTRGQAFNDFKREGAFSSGGVQRFDCF